MVSLPNFEKAKNYCLTRLKNELPPELTYHSLYHTVSEVVPAVEKLGMMEKLDKDDQLLLTTAAWYHDIGFIRQRTGHETVSIQLVEQTLPEFGYSDVQVSIIRNIIQTTRLPQSPRNLLEKIMADADLDYLGADNFWQRSTDLRQELENFATVFSEIEWYNYQAGFIKLHRYFTTTEQNLREAQKQLYLAEIVALLDKALQQKQINSPN